MVHLITLLESHRFARPWGRQSEALLGETQCTESWGSSRKDRISEGVFRGHLIDIAGGWLWSRMALQVGVRQFVRGPDFSFVE